MSDTDSPDVPDVNLVRCPDPLKPLFAQAESIFDGFFRGLERKPEAGELWISGVRYTLMRAESIGMELYRELSKSFGDAGARQVAYKIGQACGKRDARMFHEKLGVDDPVMKLALGPVHFAHVGWAMVDILPESAPAPDDSYLLVYDHPNSFEAQAWKETGETSRHPVCNMNAGYSAGWCEVSFGIELKSQELTCRGCGQDRCLFVMAPPKKLTERVAEVKSAYGLS